MTYFWVKRKTWARFNYESNLNQNLVLLRVVVAKRIQHDAGLDTHLPHLSFLSQEQDDKGEINESDFNHIICCSDIALVATH